MATDEVLGEQFLEVDWLLPLRPLKRFESGHPVHCKTTFKGHLKSLQRAFKGPSKGFIRPLKSLLGGLEGLLKTTKTLYTPLVESRSEYKNYNCHISATFHDF